MTIIKAAALGYQHMEDEAFCQDYHLPMQL